jgi:hypothetical protein
VIINDEKQIEKKGEKERKWVKGSRKKKDRGRKGRGKKIKETTCVKV